MMTAKKESAYLIFDEVCEGIMVLIKHNVVFQVFIVTQLLLLALEFEEDVFFCHLVKNRLTKNVAWQSHDEVWQ